MIRILLHYFRDFLRLSRWRVAVFIGLTLISSLLQGVGLLMILPFLQILGVIETTAAMPGFVRALVDLWQSSFIPFTLGSALAGYFLLVSSVAVLRYVQTCHERRLTVEFTRHRRARLFRLVIGASWPFLAALKRSDLQLHLRRDIGQVEGVINQTLKLSVQLMVGGVYVLVALQLSPALTLFCFLGGGMILLILRPLRRWIERASAGEREVDRSTFRQMDERVAMIKLVKGFGRERQERDEFDDLTRGYVKFAMRSIRLNSLSPIAFTILGAAFLCGYVFLGASVLNVPAERMLILILLFSRTLPIFSGLQSYRNLLARNSPALRALRAIEIDLEARQDSRPAAAEVRPLPLEREIRLSSVGYSYPRTRRPAVENLGFAIEARQITALAGASGAGKSTTADLVLGLLRPDSGEIAIDGVTLDGSTLVRWRASTAYMPQEQLLMHDTIRANLKWASPEATDEDLWEALERASAAEFVRQTPDGLDTIVGEGGTRLSGGERQRISLARALVRSPSLLVLDEPTSALDDENEAVIEETLQRLKATTTILLIAHRESTLNMADTVIRIENGRTNGNQISDQRAG